MPLAPFQSDRRIPRGPLLACTLVLSVWCGLPRTGLAQDFVAGARPTGSAGAYTSVATGPSGIYHNPAGIPFARMYAGAGTYQYQSSESILNATLVDSKTNPKVTAGAGYSYLASHGDADSRSGHDLRLALAVPAIGNRFSVGVGGRYLTLDRDDTEFARGFTLDGGVIVRITDNFHAGVAGKNLLEICDRQVRCRGAAPRILAGGLSYGRSTAFQLAADLEADLNSDPDDVHFDIEIGGEYLAAGTVPIRLGFRRETADSTNHVTTGLGWRSTQFGADAGVDFDLDELSGVTASVTFAIYFQ